MLLGASTPKCRLILLPLANSQRLHTCLTGREKDMEFTYYLLPSFSQVYRLASLSSCLSHSWKARPLTEPDLLNFYAVEWRNYSKNAQVIDAMCAFHNDFLVTSVMEELNVKKKSINSIFVDNWANGLLVAYEDVLIRVTFNEIRKERQENIPPSLNVHTVMKSLVDLLPQTPCIENGYAWAHYKDTFEMYFMGETSEFYKTESEKYLQTHTIIDYSNWVGACMENEEIRANLIFDEEAEKRLIDVTRNSLVRDHAEKLLEAISILLRENNDAGVEKVFKILSSCDEFMSTVVKTVKTYVNELGVNEIQKANKEPDKSEHMKFANAVIQVRKRCRVLDEEVFFKNYFLTFAIKFGSCKFINKNVFTEGPEGSKKPSYLLARYADAILRKNSKELQNIDRDMALEHIVDAALLLDNKDYFEHWYMALLARRLVLKRSACLDRELALANKLKSVWGVLPTGKCASMLKDVNYNLRCKALFDEWLRSKKRDLSDLIDFSVMSVREARWPFRRPKYKLILPYELEKCIDVYTEFNRGLRDPATKLSWIYQLSLGELVTHYTEKSYTFLVTTTQIAVLMLFNERNCCTIHQIMKLTNLEEHTVDQIIRQFLIKGILMIAQTDASERQLREQQFEKLSSDRPSTVPKNLSPDMLFTLNFNYTNKRTMVDLTFTLKFDEKLPKKRIEASVDRSRKQSIEARIVEIMKRTKHLCFPELVGKVRIQLGHLFIPELGQIKNAIEGLIERGICRRDPNDVNKFLYNE
nr:cullin 1 [Hymenolepis microstoma]